MLKEFGRLLINKDATVREAMKLLDETAEKILFVIENDNKLFGSLTDGDIRRWILGDGKLDVAVEKVCFKETYFVFTKYEIEKVKDEILKRKILYVPVVDNRKIIKEFLVWDKIFDGKVTRKIYDKLDIPVVIMAGGLGSRLDPFTRILPKSLIPIGDKTIIEKIIEKFLDYKINHFYITVNHKAKIIKSYFEELQPDYKVSFLAEDKPLGTVGALKFLEDEINGDILLTNCDIIIDADYYDLILHHKESKNLITLVASVKHYHIPYGICEVETGGQLVNINEKPEYEFLVNTGMYVINSAALKYIPKNKFFHVTHLIEQAKLSGENVGIYPIGENSWVDTGEWAEYKKTISKLEF
jgi:dTDP-glucose pyrophosphorylase